MVLAWSGFEGLGFVGVVAALPGWDWRPLLPFGGWDWALSAVEAEAVTMEGARTVSSWR